MTPEQINAAIAESLGLKPFDPLGYAVALPNYHGSLDAIVPVVRALPEDDQESVFDWLDVKASFNCMATPAEWCEAYLKWKGLWK